MTGITDGGAIDRLRLVFAVASNAQRYDKYGSHDELDRSEFAIAHTFGLSVFRLVAGPCCQSQLELYTIHMVSQPLSGIL